MLLSTVNTTISVISRGKHVHCHHRRVSGLFTDGRDVLQIWRVYEEEDVRSYKVTLRKGRILETKRKH